MNFSLHTHENNFQTVFKETVTSGEELQRRGKLINFPLLFDGALPLSGCKATGLIGLVFTQFFHYTHSHKSLTGTQNNEAKKKKCVDFSGYRALARHFRPNEKKFLEECTYRREEKGRQLNQPKF